MRFDERRSRGVAVGGRRMALVFGASVVAAGAAIGVFLASGTAVAAPAPQWGVTSPWTPTIGGGPWYAPEPRTAVVDTTTATGSVSWPVTLGAPSAEVRVFGLTAAAVTKGEVAVGDLVEDTKGNAANRVIPVDIPAGTRLARVELVPQQAGSQAAMSIYDQNLRRFSQGSGTGKVWYWTASPAPQRWWVNVNGVKAAPGATTVPYELRVFLVPETPVGNATPSLEPLTGTPGTQGTLTLRWAGLTPGTPYLGLVTYGADSSAESTVVSVG